MSLVIDHPTRGRIKIKTFDETTLQLEKKKSSLTKIVSVVQSAIEVMQKKGASQPLTGREADFISAAEGWCNMAQYFASDGCDERELLQVAKIGQEVEGFTSLTAAPGEAFWVEELAVTPHNLTPTKSGIGTVLMASACLEGRRRGFDELNLHSLESAVGFYQRLDMQESKDNKKGLSTFSLNLSQSLPPKLEEVMSQIHAAKRVRTISQEEESPSKRRSIEPTPLLEAARAKSDQE